MVYRRGQQEDTGRMIMELKIEPFSSLCALKEFHINGKEANYLEFGDRIDMGDDPMPNCCANMRFMPLPHRDTTLKKYGITKYEYYEISKKLEELLSFGACCLCS